MCRTETQQRYRRLNRRLLGMNGGRRAPTPGQKKYHFTCHSFKASQNGVKRLFPPVTDV